jgi:nitrogenase molybdenum-iron protein alpha/beta subunit
MTHDDSRTSPPGLDRGQLQGKTLAGGPRTRAAFARLLNLGPRGAGQETRVAAVGWVVDHVEVEVQGPDDRSVIFYLDRYQGDKPRLLQSEALVLYYRGKSLWPELEDRVRAVGLERFAGRTIEDLAALVAADPEVDLVRDRVPQGSQVDQESFDQGSLLSTWASEQTWYQFFAVAETARGRLDSLDIFERCNFIQHCDRDCLQVTPHTSVPMVDKVLYPWLERVRKLGCAPHERAAARGGRRREAAPAPAAAGPLAGAEGSDDGDRHSMCTTDLGERDVVMGALDKLTAVLDHVMQRGVDNMLFLSCTCVPFVTGEDVESLVRRYRDKTQRPFFYLTTTPKSSLGVFREVLVRQRQQAEADHREPPDPHAVNLIGFALDPALRELEQLLGQAGVGVNAVFIPHMNFGVIKDLPRAALHVLYPNALWQNLYDQLLFDSRIRSVELAAPYGLAGTRRWLEAVAAAVGLEVNAAPLVERCLEPLRERWERARAEAAGYRVGFVIGADEVHRLCDPAATWGVPLIAVLEEMGFGLEVLLKVAGKQSATTAATKVNAMFAEPARHVIRAFKDRTRMEKLLDEGASAAVFSEHMFDHRLSAVGKAQFSLQEFEKGVGGAVRTIERLLTICRLPLFRRYRKYFRRPPQPEPGASAPAGEPA